jgi:hypothetical protein
MYSGVQHILCCVFCFSSSYVASVPGLTIFSSGFSNTKGMVEIYDIMSITCQNLYHMPYQPSTYNTPQAVGSRGDIGFSG